MILRIFLNFTDLSPVIRITRILISNVELETSYQFRKCNFRNVDISDIGKPNTRSKKGKISIFIFSLQIIDLQSEMAVQ